MKDLIKFIFVFVVMLCSFALVEGMELSPTDAMTVGWVGGLLAIIIMQRQ